VILILYSLHCQDIRFLHTMQVDPLLCVADSRYIPIISAIM